MPSSYQETSLFHIAVSSWGQLRSLVSRQLWVCCPRPWPTSAVSHSFQDRPLISSGLTTVWLFHTVLSKRLKRYCLRHLKTRVFKYHGWVVHKIEQVTSIGIVLVLLLFFILNRFLNWCVMSNSIKISHIFSEPTSNGKDQHFLEPLKNHTFCSHTMNFDR